jgi:hypothetical protein
LESIRPTARQAASIGVGFLRVAALALVLLFPHNDRSADRALPGVKAKQGKEIQLQKAFAADSPQFASALLAVHHDSPGNNLGVQLTRSSFKRRQPTQFKSITDFAAFCLNILDCWVVINQDVTKMVGGAFIAWERRSSDSGRQQRSSRMPSLAA